MSAVSASSSSLPSVVVQESIPEPIQDVVSPLGNSILKRKRHTVEEFPSSSPPRTTVSPLPDRTTVRNRREIASTPDRSPRRQVKIKHEGVFLDDVLEAEADESSKDSQEGADSPYGQQPSESLSEPDRIARQSTQALFRAATPHVDFDIALPDGRWSGDEDAETADKSLSEPDRTARQSTQALLRAATPHIDFDIPRPDGGWGGDDDEEEEAETADKAVSDSQNDIAQEGPVVQETQAILDSKTQVPDFTIPDPDDPWTTLLPPSSPPTLMPSSPAAASDFFSTMAKWRIDPKAIEQQMAANTVPCLSRSTSHYPGSLGGIERSPSLNHHRIRYHYINVSPPQPSIEAIRSER